MEGLNKVDYSGWYEVRVRPTLIESLDDDVYHMLPCRTSNGKLIAKCWVNGNVAIAEEFYKEK